jgi:CRISPR/Cas system-associated exonuclease Cas4 (RecB family)
MKSFIEELAAHILAKHAGHMDKLCVVLPNRRAGLFLKKQIAQQAGKTLWAPRIKPLDELVAEKTGLILCDSLRLMAELFEVHREMHGEESGEFSEFINWAGLMIRDFNDTDHYLADAQRLYNYLDATRAISLWNPDGRPLTEFQHKYLDFFHSMYGYYSGLKKRLIAKQFAYAGMAFRTLAEGVAEAFSDSREYYLFAGFNALTAAEESIIRHLISEGKAECIWDSDRYYSDNPVMEAGTFLRTYKERWNLKEIPFTGEHYKNRGGSIQIIGVAGQTGQAKVCGELLSRMSLEEAEQTCVVLADEQLLIPVLNSIPEGISKFNITMGFPLQLSPVHQLAEALFNLHESSMRLAGLRNDDKTVFLFDTLSEVITHPYILQWTAVQNGNAGRLTGREINDHFIRNRQYMIYREELSGLLSKYPEEVGARYALLFKTSDGADQGILDLLSEILEQLLHFFIEQSSSASESEYVDQYLQLLNSARIILKEYHLETDLRAARAILKMFTQNSSIPFYGEPLTGFQIMGVLETRCLDFKRMIMLSVNDDLIPGGMQQQSYIPYDIRIEFGLPTYKEKEAVYAYHFYRLLQRCEHACLICNTESGTMGGGEKSRFIEQMQHELPVYNPKIKITEEVFSLAPLLNQASTEIIIPKDTAIMEAIHNKAASGLSPSSLNAFVSCPLKFYLSDILRLRPEEEVAESLDAAMLGQAIHEVLHHLYQPYLNQFPDLSNPSAFKKTAADLCEQVFRKMLNGGDFHYGKNFLLYQVARSYIETFINAEAENYQQGKKAKEHRIAYLEQELGYTYEPGIFAGFGVKLKGFADRIDSLGDNVRIIDYKSGAVKEKELKPESLEVFFSDKHSDKAFQLMCYACLYFREHPEFAGSIESGIISFRLASRGLIPLNLNDNKLITRSDCDAFEEILKQGLQPLFDEQNPFTQTSDPKVCEYCDFKAFCYR